MNKLKALVIDDEWNMRNLLRIYLTKEGFDITEAHNGTEGLSYLQKNSYHVILLDVMMPDMDGWHLCEKIRSFTETPILMLTARGDVKDKVHGLGVGADDYMVKPVNSDELIARLFALVRRSSQSLSLKEIGKKIMYTDMIIYPDRRQVMVLDTNLDLTQKELDILLILAENPQRVFSRDEIIERLWGSDFFGDNRVVDTHVKNIREKLQLAGLEQNPIQTVWGIGYKWLYSVEEP
ncbi:response regulator transcription factor [Paenibacillus sp. 11B]|uniref:Response regulator transcription factor n=3 Tax=cellular organisms TaxID=131567 RepID=A0A7Y6BV38_9BACL|nr:MULTISPECIES: response regulator transcription factor [Paenibacillus]MDN8593121.1 response regulator transcription factor [Paenibacillus sp. 11B]NUU75366.1 response regulator transcription factor [Paenibacillus xylanilyticus]